MPYLVFMVTELRRALLVFVGGSFVLEFLKEGLVSNAVDLHIFLFIAIGVYLLSLLLPKLNHP